MNPPVPFWEQKLDFLEQEEQRRTRRYQNTTRPAPEWEEQGFVFPGRGGAQRVECGAVDRIKKAADLPKHFRPFHGLRQGTKKKIKLSRFGAENRKPITNTGTYHE